MVKTKKGGVVEVKAEADAISGFGHNVVKVLSTETGGVICYVGMVDGCEMVWFPKPATYEQVEAVYGLMHKKKFHKALADGKTQKAQAYADKRLSKKN